MEGHTSPRGGVAGRWTAADRDRPAGDSDVGHSRHTDADVTLLPSLLCAQAVGGGAPCSLTEHFSEVLLALNRHCPALLSQWLRETLQTPGFPSAQASAEQKHTFSQQLLRWRRTGTQLKAQSSQVQIEERGKNGSNLSV